MKPIPDKAPDLSSHFSGIGGAFKHYADEMAKASKSMKSGSFKSVDENTVPAPFAMTKDMYDKVRYIRYEQNMTLRKVAQEAVSKLEKLDLEVMDIPPNQKVYKKPTVMLTEREDKLIRKIAYEKNSSYRGVLMFGLSLVIDGFEN